MRRTPLPALLGLAILAPAAQSADPPKPAYGKSAERIVLTNEPWAGQPKSPATPAEIDRLVREELARLKLTPAPLTTDEQFIRRVTLDVVGRLPAPAQIAAFVADKSPDKRARLIDTLLADDDYARHWARSWRDVVAAKVTDRIILTLVPAFEAWLHEAFQANRPWDEMARAMMTADGEMMPGDADAKNGASFFLLSRTGDDARTDRAAETARLFLGMQIQCAQCHDHPFDAWKREQFHELTAFYAKVRDGRFRNPKGQFPPFGLRLLSSRFTEHKMPDKNDPSKGTVMRPKFLDGTTAPADLRDEELRKLLADKVTRDNYWFAAAYVNRVWGELLGQAFVTPVDDMGPGKETRMPAVLTRLAASFKATGYDQKAFLKLVLNTEAYQRQILPGSRQEHLRFAGAAPGRLSADELWHALTAVIGAPPQPPGMMARRPLAAMQRGPFGFERQFEQEFFFDPSLRPDEVEGSVPQALLLMNNPMIQYRLSARGPTLLGQLLMREPDDGRALQFLYLKVLARKPTDRERQRNLDYVRQVGHRGEAFEDILWVLLNSTEFLTRR